MGAQLALGILVFAVLIIGVMYFLWQVVHKDSINMDLDFHWDIKVTREQIEYTSHS